MKDGAIVASRKNEWLIPNDRDCIDMGLEQHIIRVKGPSEGCSTQERMTSRDPAEDWIDYNIRLQVI
jgi:hypothetical protein